MDKKQKKVLLEWTFIFSIFLILCLYKYFTWGCLFICGDWYDD